MPLINAGLKCSNLILSNGGTPNGVSQSQKKGLSHVCCLHENNPEKIIKNRMKNFFMIAVYWVNEAKSNKEKSKQYKKEEDTLRRISSIQPKPDRRQAGRPD
jgi:hypothetical protein